MLWFSANSLLLTLLFNQIDFSTILHLDWPNQILLLLVDNIEGLSKFTWPSASWNHLDWLLELLGLLLLLLLPLQLHRIQLLPGVLRKSVVHGLPLLRPGVVISDHWTEGGVCAEFWIRWVATEGLCFEAYGLALAGYTMLQLGLVILWLLLLIHAQVGCTYLCHVVEVGAAFIFQVVVLALWFVLETLYICHWAGSMVIEKFLLVLHYYPCIKSYWGKSFNWTLLNSLNFDVHSWVFINFV